MPEKIRIRAPKFQEVTYNSTRASFSYPLDRKNNSLLLTEEEIVTAPCRPGGNVSEVDYDTKEGMCFCEFHSCPVDGKNRVIS